MKQKRCIIIDDDQGAIDVLKAYIATQKKLHLVAWFTDPLEAQAKIPDLAIDLAFMDVEMGELSGFDLLPFLDPKTKVIFCTGHEEFAVQSYNYNAVDYLMKPVTLPRFLLAIRKVDQLDMQNPAVSVYNEEELFFLFFYGGKYINRRVDLCDIDYIKGSEKGAVIYFTQGDQLQLSYPLKRMEEALPKSAFLRVNQSYIISLSRYYRYENEMVYLTGARQTGIPVGKTYWLQLLKWINANAIMK